MSTAPIATNIEPSGQHAHQCLGCGLIWFHPHGCKGVETAHKCPNCGKVQWQQAILPVALPQMQTASASAFDQALGWTLLALGLGLMAYGVWQYVRSRK